MKAEKKNQTWYLKNRYSREKIFLNIGITTIGRGRARDIRTKITGLSKHHCDIILEGDEINVIDKVSLHI